MKNYKNITFKDFVNVNIVLNSYEENWSFTEFIEKHVSFVVL